MATGLYNTLPGSSQPTPRATKMTRTGVHVFAALTGVATTGALWCVMSKNLVGVLVLAAVALLAFAVAYIGAVERARPDIPLAIEAPAITREIAFAQDGFEAWLLTSGDMLLADFEDARANERAAILARDHDEALSIDANRDMQAEVERIVRQQQAWAVEVLRMEQAADLMLTDDQRAASAARLAARVPQYQHSGTWHNYRQNHYSTGGYWIQNG